MSGSAALDHNLRVIADYAERELKQDQDRDPCLIEGWDEKRLSEIIAKQRAAVVKAKISTPGSTPDRSRSCWALKARRARGEAEGGLREGR